MASYDSQNTVTALTKVRKPFFTRPLTYAIILAAVAGTLGIMVGFCAPVHLQKALFTGSIGLIFGGLFTVIVKLLVEDHQRERDLTADQARFMSNVSSDLKSVYDRVERARIVIAAHQSALTYGTEMRDMIDSRVQLRNVIRALSDETMHSNVRRAVQAMESYLKGLTDDFESIYLGASKSQAEYEAEKKRIVGDKNKKTSELTSLENKAWPQIAEALHSKGFIRYAKESDAFPTDYEKNFEDPLDLASWLLRNELRKLAGYRQAVMPDEYSKIAKRLEEGEKSQKVAKDTA